MSVDVSGVAYYRIFNPVSSVIAIENVAAAIHEIAQTTLRAVVGRHMLDETLSETERVNRSLREMIDVQTEEWGVVVTLVEVKDIQLPEGMKRAMARQAEAEREKRAKIIAAEGEALAAGEFGRASDIMDAHPLALQLRNLQTLVESWWTRTRPSSPPRPSERAPGHRDLPHARAGRGAGAAAPLDATRRGLRRLGRIGTTGEPMERPGRQRR